MLNPIFKRQSQKKTPQNPFHHNSRKSDTLGTEQKKNTVPHHNFENCYENILVENEIPTSSCPIKNELNRFILLIEIFAIILHHSRPFISSFNWRKSPIDGFSLSVEEAPRGTSTTTNAIKEAKVEKRVIVVWYGTASCWGILVFFIAYQIYYFYLLWKYCWFRKWVPTCNQLRHFLCHVMWVSYIMIYTSHQCQWTV